MKLVVGLGNPGVNYAKTHHNVGFLAIEKLLQHYGYEKHKHRFQADLFFSTLNKEKVIFAKPLTFMNLSGQSVRQLVDYYKIPITDLLVIHDEKDFPKSHLQFRIGGSAGGHNGLKSIIHHLGTSDFKRLRIGIDKPQHSHQLAHYVLSPLTSLEEEKLNQRITLILPFLNQWTQDSNFQTIMNTYNRPYNKGN